MSDRSLHDPQAVKKVANRLRRAQGQLAAVIAAVEGGGDCRDVVTQLAAVSSAIDRAGFAIISTAMKQCIADPDADDADVAERLTVDELEKLFLTLA
ncbi:metal-sensitive transcriptional regulator [Microbacterium testaceum]|uniref:metal-sensitive transcriptional regulator n=1 Tax=Microbacterium testaceum TaxID=2033 RepID=UPI0022E3E37B|nr:metal-sensitive transcriptional regulator [Microbacterium testaceum]